MAPKRVISLERQVCGLDRDRFRYVFREAETREIVGAIDTDKSRFLRQIAVDNRKRLAHHNPLENGRGASLSLYGRGERVVANRNILREQEK